MSVFYIFMFLCFLYLLAKFNLILDTHHDRTDCVDTQGPEDGLICPKQEMW
jgi:hypothetical protein